MCCCTLELKYKPSSTSKEDYSSSSSFHLGKEDNTLFWLGATASHPVLTVQNTIKAITYQIEVTRSDHPKSKNILGCSQKGKNTAWIWLRSSNPKLKVEFQQVKYWMELAYKNKGLFQQAASVKKTEKPLKLKPQRNLHHYLQLRHHFSIIDS